MRPRATRAIVVERGIAGACTATAAAERWARSSTRALICGADATGGGRWVSFFSSAAVGGGGGRVQAREPLQ
jgi:hypothetical protein